MMTYHVRPQQIKNLLWTVSLKLIFPSQKLAFFICHDQTWFVRSLYSHCPLLKYILNCFYSFHCVFPDVLTSHCVIRFQQNTVCPYIANGHQAACQSINTTWEHNITWASCCIKISATLLLQTWKTKSLQWRHLSVMMSEITNNLTVCSTMCHAHINENIKLYNWSFVRELHQWLIGSRTKGSQCEKDFYVMKSSRLYEIGHAPKIISTSISPWMYLLFFFVSTAYCQVFLDMQLCHTDKNWSH